MSKNKMLHKTLLISSLTWQLFMMNIKLEKHQHQSCGTKNFGFREPTIRKIASNAKQTCIYVSTISWEFKVTSLFYFVTLKVVAWWLLIKCLATWSLLGILLVILYLAGDAGAIKTWWTRNENRFSDFCHELISCRFLFFLFTLLSVPNFPKVVIFIVATYSIQYKMHAKYVVLSN